MLDINDLVGQIILGDCLDIMPDIPDKSIDCIICDLPYGTTACKWDVIIPFDKLWEQYNRIIKDNGAIVLTASQPFTTDLINSNRLYFKYELIWDKVNGKDFYQSNRQFLKQHENILVFYKKLPTYNPQMVLAEKHNIRDRQKNFKKSSSDTIYGKQKEYKSTKDEKLRFPGSIFKHSYQANELHYSKRLHPTQKPVALMEYLIKTYTNENDIILDNCSGSGTLAIAAHRTGRQFICIEKDPEYHRLACERVEKEKLNLFNTGG